MTEPTPKSTEAAAVWDYTLLQANKATPSSHNAGHCLCYSHKYIDISLCMAYKDWLLAGYFLVYYGLWRRTNSLILPCARLDLSVTETHDRQTYCGLNIHPHTLPHPHTTSIPRQTHTHTHTQQTYPDKHTHIQTHAHSSWLAYNIRS